MANKPTHWEPRDVNYVSRGLAIGLTIGAGLGVVLSAATDNPGMLAIGTGCGISLGVAIGSSQQRQHEAAQLEEAGDKGEDGVS
jgi:hypothetical protein